MLRPMLTCCKLYISESQNARALESIEHAARHYPEAVLINKFKDDAYNRVGYTLVSPFSADSSPDAPPLRNAVFSMVREAFREINLEAHCGTHPRLGVVDHICFHPLGQTSLDLAAQLAKSVAASIGHKLQVPTFLYGAAHEGGRSLASIRRELGYFKANSAGGQWVGSLPLELLHLKSDAGPPRLDRARGVVVIGASGWVDNYNVPIQSNDIEVVRRIARRVSWRGGGLESVQAMGLAHSEGTTEVACNLLEPSRVGDDMVQAEVERLAGEEGLVVGKGYFTDFPQEKIIDIYLKSLGSD